MTTSDSFVFQYILFLKFKKLFSLKSLSDEAYNRVKHENKCIKFPLNWFLHLIPLLFMQMEVLCEGILSRAVVLYSQNEETTILIYKNITLSSLLLERVEMLQERERERDKHLEHRTAIFDTVSS